MSRPTVDVAVGHVRIGPTQPLAWLLGPCVIESEAHALRLGRDLADITRAAGVPAIFKASFDKANRTSLSSFRGPGLEDGLRILAAVRSATGLPVMTDIHEPPQAAAAARVVDLLQIPAFLCRQTDLLVAAAATGRPVNVKKGQFLAPRDMQHVVGKLTASGATGILLTERGTSFGYHNLIVDMRSLPMMRALGPPVVFDITHSLQLPGAGDGVTSGLAEYIRPLGRAGVAAGVDAVFLEVHEHPPSARSDAANALALAELPALVAELTDIHAAVARHA